MIDDQKDRTALNDHDDESSTRQAGTNDAVEPLLERVPDVGEVLKRLRARRGLALKDVAEASDLSPSFLSAVERGASDISLGRLARLAAFFGHDVGSLLGYSARRTRLQVVTGSERFFVDRGDGVRYEVLHLPGFEMELILLDFEPGAGFREGLSHEGVDILLVTQGELIVTLADTDHTLKARECAVWSAAYTHRMRNALQDEHSSAIAVVTESVY